MSMNKNKFDAVIVRAICFLCAVAGIVLRLTENYLPGNQFAYFDVQLTLVVAIFFTALTVISIVDLVRHGGEGDSPTISGVIHNVIVCAVAADTVAFWAISSWAVFPADHLLTPSTILLHGFLPAMIVVDWILFLPHGRFRCYFTPLPLALPALSYSALLIIASGGYVFFEKQFGAYYRRVNYPYAFFEPDAMGGVGAVVGIVALFAIGFFAISVLLWLLDRALSGKKTNKISFYDAKKEKRK